MIEFIKQHLEQLDDRERKMVYGAAFVLAIFLPYQLIWAPFMNGISSLNESVELQEKDLLWMQSKIPEVRQMNHAMKGSAPVNQSIYAVVEKTARNKFGGDLRVQQEGKKGIRIIIKNTSFDEVVTWLDMLNFKHHVYIKEFRVDREKAVGRVKVNVLIEG